MTSQAHGSRSPRTTWCRALFAGLAATFVLTLAACSGGPPFHDPAGGIPPSTQLAISPSGKQLLVSWREGSKATRAKLITLADGAVQSMRDVPLPADTFMTRWSRSEDQVLVINWAKDKSELLRVDVQTNARTVLYTSAAILRFPIEVGDGAYVFLEGTAPGVGLSRWQRLEAGNKTVLSDQVYTMAAPLQQVQGSLHLMDPTKRYTVFEGQLPAGLRELINASTWSITCADKVPLTCVRSHLYMPRDGGSFGTEEIFNGAKRCDVAGRWVDTRELQFSRHGTAVVFHAALEKHGGPRAIYVIPNDGACKPVPIFIKGATSGINPICCRSNSVLPSAMAEGERPRAIQAIAMRLMVDLKLRPAPA